VQEKPLIPTAESSSEVRQTPPKSEWLNGDGQEAPAIYIRWYISRWCNYDCSYCPQTHHPQDAPYYIAKDLVRRPYLLPRHFFGSHTRSHAFSNFPVEQWLESFAALSDKRVSLTMTGGEPFLDRGSFDGFLAGLTQMPHIRAVRIDTNGTWNPARLSGVDWEKVLLNISFHPEQTNLEKFKKSMARLVDAGVHIGMVNFVMAPSQLDDFNEIRDAMGELGIFVNANVFVEVRGMRQEERAFALYEQLVPDLDVQLKTKALNTKGKPCRFPTQAYQLDPTGLINVGCHPSQRCDFIGGHLPDSPTAAVACPRQHCGCLDMYSFLEEATDRGNQLDILAEYRDLVLAHRSRHEADTARARV